MAGVWISGRWFAAGGQYCRPYSKEEANVRLLLLLSCRLFLLNQVIFDIGVVMLRSSELVQENSPLFARRIF